MSISIDQLSSEITKALQTYTTEVEEGLEKAKEKAAKDGAKTLRSTSPKRFGKDAKSWTATKEGKSWVIHVKAPHYRLAHLLEKGHAKRGGGRVPGRVHIAPVEEQTIDQYERDVERVIRG